MSSGDVIPAAAASIAQNFTKAQISELCSSWSVDNGPLSNGLDFGPPDGSKRPSAALVWCLGLSFVTAISLCALVGIAVMRFLRKAIYNRFITFFVGLGVGSLSGSAVFHLLPQAFGLADEFNPNSNHDYLYKASAAVFGIYLFFFCDKLIKMVLETRKRHKHEFTELPTISNSQPHSSRASNNLDQPFPIETKYTNGTTPLISTQKENEEVYKDTIALPDNGAAEESMGRQAHGICVHDHDLDYKQGDSVIATVAWMIIFGDGLHNLIDGISIGASFSESVLSGVSVSVAVLCEEFPHELGDVAILVSAGMTLRQALVYNLLSALTCYIGFFFGVLIGNVNEHFASYTFGFAGGMFLYISLACMMPEMKHAMEEALQVSLKHGIEVLLLQVSGLICGLTLMLCMARYGGDISFE
ncbi:hypothetical protein L596_005255 [Steinernema carpocapsae]|uniref:Zinc transporter ZIP14 n=1 Tax=Steinernema carpocapsae TaxID=34508 RepID=A0A4U8V2N6_STECR|nr:hypothetical protein L596_005255 [Steinernema carpocapsae]